MSIERFIQRMPKVELHVHLEGSIQPETLLALAERNHVTLPARSVAELRNWYVFKDFSHFVEVYLTICDCVRTPADMELITLDFLKGQARQNIRYSELIFTPYSHREHISFEDQWTAIQKAHTWAKTNLGVTMNLAPDISRQIRPIEHSMLVAEWAVKHKDDGIIALGLGGAEIGNPPELFQEAFDYAYTAGLAGAPHAG
ncbi:MAG: adenosine deaminase, partial [Chloroflexota bacterium]